MKIGVIGLLGILFVALKLTHQIDWSWFWVTMPLWIGLAIIGALLLFAWTMAVLVWVLERVGK